MERGQAQVGQALCILSSGARGSKILVTTRNIHIANMVGSVNPIHLNGLDENSCWAVLKKCAFGLQNSRDHPQLEAIAKEMVPKLRGLPLAARTLGGLLNRNMNEEHWRAIMDSEIWKLPQEEHGVLLVLQLSYQYLPAHLKRCFAFCSLYPKDHLFDEHELVRIWMAEGFFPAYENIRMEDFGSVCIQELVCRSFFQQSQFPYEYVMHDLIHDLAQSISGGETYRLEDGKPVKIPTMLRHLNIACTKDDKDLKRMMDDPVQPQAFNKLRTLIFPRLPVNSALTSGFLNRLQSIRTLILDNCELTEIPESIGDFIHVRYLSIYGNSKINELPDSLFKLYNLQALIFRGCDLHELPDSIGNLFYLRYLNIFGNFKISKLPHSLFKLYNLQALILANCDLHELPDSIGNLFDLRYLDISQNKNLNKLPESLCRLSNLQTLVLYGCNLQSLPQGMSRLINMRKLNVEDNLVSQITGVGKLRYLQSLSIFNVGKMHGRKVAELSDLTQLCGGLIITSLENVESKEEAIAAKLQSKLYLVQLQLQWTNSFGANSFSDLEEEVLEHLQPNSTLKCLMISGYSGARSPSWLQAESLSNLTALYLEDCKRLDDLSFIRHELSGSSESNWFHREWFPCLRVLEIRSCPMIRRLPLLPASLKTLTLDQVGLTELPEIQEGIGGSRSNIATLFHQDVWIIDCPNFTSLDRIECFPCLHTLWIYKCPLLTRLSPLPPLVELHLIEVGLTELLGMGGSSSNIATASPLKVRIINCANLARLEWFPYMKSLEIKDCPLLTRLPPLPPSLVELQFIQVGLIELPGIDGSSSDIATVSPLVVRVSKCPNLTSLDMIEYFPCLKSLDIEDCPFLTKLPPLPPLVELQLIQVGLTELPEIGGSSTNITTVSLSVLRIRKCSSLTNLGAIECSPSLSVVEIDNCPLLTRLPPLPPSLVELQIIQVELIELLEMSESSNNIATISLSVLRIRKCASLTNLGGLDCSPCLSILEIDNCPLLTRLPLLPPSLVELQLIQVGLKKLPGISRSSSNIATTSPLGVWIISKCANLTSLEWFPCLKSLDIEDCPLLTRLPPLPPSLEKLQLIHVGLTKLPGIDGNSSNIAPASLSVLHIEECLNLISLEHGLLSYNLPKLEIIFVKNCRELLTMPVKKLKEFTYLKFFSIVNCPKLMSTAQDDDIHLLLPPSIRRLKLSNCGKVNRSLPGCLCNLTTLTELELCECPHLVTLAKEPLLHLEGLEILCLMDCNELRSIKGVEFLKSLKLLKIHGCPRLQVNEGDRQGENIFSLVKLDVDNTAFLRVSPLRNTLPSIKTLRIECSPEVNMFEGEDQELLRSLTSLKYLAFHNCKNLQSLPTELHAFPSLEVLVINECTQIQSLPEKGLPISLKDLLLSNFHSTLEKQLKEHLAEMKISGRFSPIHGGIRWRRNI